MVKSKIGFKKWHFYISNQTNNDCLAVMTKYNVSQYLRVIVLTIINDCLIKLSFYIKINFNDMHQSNHTIDTNYHRSAVRRKKYSQRTSLGRNGIFF